MPPLTDATALATTLASLLAAFETSPLVALGEAHFMQEQADFIAALIQHPSFPTLVQDIVVEFGNARYQPLIDRFLAGEALPLHKLRPVWRDLAGNPFGAFDAPIYARFFRIVQRVNRDLPHQHQIRVLLGDPPIDWTMVHTPDDLEPFMLDRDDHYARVVEREVLRRGRRALLVAGSLHFRRLSGESGRQTVVQQIERQQPGSTFVIAPHEWGSQRGPAFDEVERILATYPIPALIPVQSSWLADVEARALYPGVGTAYNSDGTTSTVIRPPVYDAAGQRHEHATLRALMDAYLYLGPVKSLTEVRADPALLRDDPVWLAEVQRRHLLHLGAPLDVEALFRK